MDEQEKARESEEAGKSQGDEIKVGNDCGPESSPFKGLCINCDNRFTCVLPRPAGGVWHCEEYS